MGADRLLLLAAGGLALVLAACGAGGPTAGGVATLQAQGAIQSGAPASPGAGGAYEQELAYSECMRSSGVPDFPDPVHTAAGGVTRNIEVQKGSDLDPESPQFKAAYGACRSLEPAASPGQRQQVDERRRTQALQYSACMRDHGVSNFPDPVFSNGNETVTLNGQVDTGSATFQAADAACQSLLPGPAGEAPDGTSQP